MRALFNWHEEFSKCPLKSTEVVASTLTADPWSTQSAVSVIPGQSFGQSSRELLRVKDGEAVKENLGITLNSGQGLAFPQRCMLLKAKSGDVFSLFMLPL